MPNLADQKETQETRVSNLKNAYPGLITPKIEKEFLAKTLTMNHLKEIPISKVEKYNILTLLNAENSECLRWGHSFGYFD